LEAETQRLEGWKVLYAQVYYTKDEFWSIHGKQWYGHLRQKYHATHLPDIYDKIKHNSSTKSAHTARRSTQPSGLIILAIALWIAKKVTGGAVRQL
jgi:hypothetical protein